MAGAPARPSLPGTPVRVRGVDGLVLRVEAEPDATPMLRDPDRVSVRLTLGCCGPALNPRPISAARGILGGSPYEEQGEMADDLASGWQHFAACRGADATLFFAPNYFEKRSQKNAREAVAKAICVAVPRPRRCLEYALRSVSPTASGAA